MDEGDGRRPVSEPRVSSQVQGTVEMRTSRSHPLRVDWLPGERVGLTIQPGKRGASVVGSWRWSRSLAADLDALAALGVATIVCLVTDEELNRLCVVGYEAAANKRGIALARFPIRDLSVPSVERVAGLLPALDAALIRGRLVIQCVGGLGRSGVVAGCHLGGGEAALRTLAKVRGPRCPETDAQRAFVLGWRK